MSKEDTARKFEVCTELLGRIGEKGRARGMWLHIPRDDDVWYFAINKQQGGGTKTLKEDTGYHQEVKHKDERIQFDGLNFK